MLHDASFFKPNRSSTHVDRRGSERKPFDSEVLIRWHGHGPGLMRFRLVDASEGGYRLRLNTPLLEGMTGVALKVLPEGDPVHRTVAVAWVRPVGDYDEADEHHEYEAGLHFLDAA